MINMNGFGFEPNSVNRVSDSQEIWRKSKSVHTDHEQIKNDVQLLNEPRKKTMNWIDVHSIVTS